jgi:hypothetical protein
LMTGKITPDDFPEGYHAGKYIRSGLQVVGGAVPFAGGLLSAIAGAWSEGEQEKVNRFIKHWMQMIADEIREKEETIVEIMARLDLNDERIAERVESREYQSILKKTFREWAGAESEDKRVLIRNILANAAASSMTSDDVIRMFVDWVGTFSVLHFKVVGAIYNSAGITRRAIWEKISKGPVREDSADADLFKLLVRDLSTGGIIRQHRETDYAGRFLKKTPTRPQAVPTSANKVAKSAFDDGDAYELTELGEQFVHYAMTDLPPRIAYNATVNSSPPES